MNEALQDITVLPLYLLNNLDIVWSYILLVIRYTAFMLIMPGIGSGAMGLGVRVPGIMVMAYATVIGSPTAALPITAWDMLSTSCAEVIFGMLLGFIPAMTVAGVQTAGQLSATTMGLGAAQLFDPTMGVQVSSIGRIMADMVVAIFLTVGGHYVIIYALAGLGGEIVPGSFLVTESSVLMIIERSSMIFYSGVMISAPVIVALLLTQFVMGLISKAVPTVNIFIVSFPLTIGIGLVLTMLCLPELVVYMEREWKSTEQAIAVLVEPMQQSAATASGTAGAVSSN